MVKARGVEYRTVSQWAASHWSWCENTS